MSWGLDNEVVTTEATGSFVEESDHPAAPGTWTRMVRFLHHVGRLKALPRSGWRHCGVPALETESVADHSYRTALLAWLAAASHPGLDRDRVLKLALVHDLAEALAGDPTPYDPADVPEDAEARRVFFSRRHVRDDERATAKRAAETAAMRELLADLPPPLAAELADLWAEAEAKQTPEARFAKQVDKLETYLQSVEYLAADPRRPMASFAADAAAVISDPALLGLRDAIRDEPPGSR
jgi:putative hydrolase of HD superfamily